MLTFNHWKVIDKDIFWNYLWIINIIIDDPSKLVAVIKIVNLTGKVVFQDNLDPEIREFQIPINPQNGIYIVQMESDNLTQFTQKLIVSVK